MLIEPKTVPIILKLCQHNWEEPTEWPPLKSSYTLQEDPVRNELTYSLSRKATHR